MEIIVLDSRVVLQGSIVEFVQRPCSARIVLPVPRAERNECLDVGQEFLGEAIDDSTIMQCCLLADVCVDFGSRIDSITLHVLESVKLIEHVNSKVVEEGIKVELLEKNVIFVV